MIGKFDYKLNCSLPHHVPQKVRADGYPVIVFARRTHDVVIGQTYEFEYELTRAATHIIDGRVYRVAHGFGFQEVETNN